MLFSDLLNFAGSLAAPTSNVSSSRPTVLLLYDFALDILPFWYLLNPCFRCFGGGAAPGFFSCSVIVIILLIC